MIEHDTMNFSTMNYAEKLTRYVFLEEHNLIVLVLSRLTDYKGHKVEKSAL